MRHAVLQLERLRLRNSLVCRACEDGRKPTRYQVIVPYSLKAETMKFAHDSISGGQLGVRKTLAKIRQNYYWVGLHKDVERYVRICDVCARKKSPLKTKRYPMQVMGAGYPMERIATDSMGPLPETDNGNHTSSSSETTSPNGLKRSQYLTRQLQQLQTV